MFVTKIFTFDAAHALTQYYGQCERLHGHTFMLHVTVEGPVAENGLVVDFTLIKKIVNRLVLSKLDHQNLNDHFPNPSAERLAEWIWKELVDLPRLLQDELERGTLDQELPKYVTDVEGARAHWPSAEHLSQIRLHEIKLFETPTSFVTHQG